MDLHLEIQYFYMKRSNIVIVFLTFQIVDEGLSVTSFNQTISKKSFLRKTNFNLFKNNITDLL